jgi:hypothetical protein
MKLNETGLKLHELRYLSQTKRYVLTFLYKNLIIDLLPPITFPDKSCTYDYSIYINGVSQKDLLIGSSDYITWFASPSIEDTFKLLWRSLLTLDSLYIHEYEWNLSLSNYLINCYSIKDIIHTYKIFYKNIYEGKVETWVAEINKERAGEYTKVIHSLPTQNKFIEIQKILRL